MTRAATVRPPLIRDARLAWVCWAAFAAVVVGLALAKHTIIMTRSGESVEGRIVSETPEAVDVSVKGSEGRAAKGEARRIARADIDRIDRYAERSVTPEYRRASSLWWASKPLYTEGVHGFLYLPQSAIAYSPFAFAPDGVREVVWVLVNIGAYAAGLWRLCGLLFGTSREERAPGFTLATILAIPAAIGSAVNGQTNLVMAGLFALAAADLIGRRWWWATLWLMLALACKPTAAVMILLVGAVYPRAMLWRLGVALGLFALAPFIHPDPGYALEQYRQCADKLLHAASPPDRFQDIRGMLIDFGLVLPEWVLTAIRGAAALATLGLCLLAAARFNERSRGAYLLAFAMMYLVLFNPRTEGVTYALLGTPAALWATREILDRRWRAAIPLVLLCLVLQFSMQVTMGYKNYWVRPVSTIAFAAYVIWQVARRRSAWERPAEVRA